MKKPTLRLRQVFEGPTHFKVVRPLGNPIKIAKKGLSPNLMGRLRKFAVSGEVPEATEQDAQNAQDLMTELMQPATRGQAVDPVAASQALDVGEVMPPAGVPVEVIRPGDVAQTPIESLPESERIKAISQMGPTLPRITEPEPLAPMKPSPAIEEEAVKTEPESALVDKSLAQIRTLIDKEMEKNDPDYKKLGSLAETYERLNKPIETPAAPVAVAAAPKAPTVVPAAAVAPAAATVAAPTAPVVPTPAVAAPKTFDITKPLDVAALQEYRKANPGMADSDLALQLVKQYTPDALEVALPEIDVAPPAGADEDTLKQFDAAKVDLIKATVNQAKADAETARAIFDANQRAQAQRLINAEKDRETADALVSRRDALRAAVEGGFKPESLYGSNNLVGQIGSALSIALGAFASGMTGIPNYALKIYNDAVERDLDIQKSKYNSLVNQYNRLLGDAADAEKLARADLNDLAALQLEGIKASSTIKGIGPATERMVAEIRAKAAKEREEVAIKQSQAREAKVEADMAQELNQSLIKQRNAAGVRASAAAGLAGLRAAQAQERIDLMKLREEFKQQRVRDALTFSVPDPTDPSKLITMNSSSIPKANEASKKILNRFTSLERVEELDNLINEARTLGEKIKPEQVKKMQAIFAGVKENYPSLSKGTEQMVTQAQNKILSDALADIPIPYLRYANLFDMTKVAVQEMRREATRDFAAAVNQYAKADDAGRIEFQSKFTEKGYAAKPVISGGKPAVPTGKARVRKDNGPVMLIDRNKLADALKIPGVTEVP